MNEQELKKLEDKLWAAADKMRGAVSVSDYKFIVLGLIFLKYISDSFEEKYKELVEEGAGLEEERDCYTAENIFYVPKNARWEYLVEHSKDTNIGEIIDDALTLIEKENTSLKNVLPKNYNSPTMRNVNLGELLDLFTNIKVGTKEAKEKDLLGRIYEYFLGQFAKNELQKGGEFYTPACLVRTMVECIEPFKGKVYDPACGSGGMFVQSMKFVEEHQGNIYNIGIYGQEKNPTTWRLAKMNLAIRSMYGDLGKYAADTFTEDLHKDLKADFILANPPFNLEWEREKVENDPRWRYGLAPKNNANFAWLQHMISKLSQNGKMACILAKGSLDVGYEEGKIRKKIVDADLVDCVIVMPSNLFYTVTVPCAIWIINRNKKKKGKTLFINASKMGTLINRKLRELSKEEISKIADIYHCYQNDSDYKDREGICKAVDITEIKKKNYNLLPGKYIENDNTEETVEEFEKKFNNTVSYLEKNLETSTIVEKELIDNFKKIKIKDSFDELPENWTVSNLTEIADYMNGLPMQKHRPKEDEESLPVLKIKELRQKMCDNDSELCSANINKDYIINDGDVVFSWSGSLLVDIWSGEKCGLNQHLFKVTSNNFDKWFYYAWTAYHLKEFSKIASDKATTMGHIKRGDLENAEVLIPSKTDYQKMKAIMDPLIKLMLEKRKETKKLEELCSSIIPRILTGELDCSNIEVDDNVDK